MRIPLDNRVDLTGPSNPPRAIYAGDEWQGETHPHILVSEGSVRIVGDLDKGLSVDPQFGTHIQGPVALGEVPENIRVASYWALNPMLLCSVGSSAAMPVPTLVPTTPPVVEARKGFSKIFG